MYKIYTKHNHCRKYDETVYTPPVDKEVLSEQSTSPRGQVVIESIIHLAKALSITTVAEGIENEVQLEFLQSVSCDIGQGYYFAKPMPVDEFERTVLRRME